MTPTTAEEGKEVASGTTIILTYVKDYSQTKDLTYTVEYYKDNVIDKTKTQTITEKVWINSEQTTVTVDRSQINTVNAFGDGYRFNHTNPEPIPSTIENNGVIKVYYVTRTDLSYTVNYLEKGTNKSLRTPKTVNNKTFGDEIISSSEIITIDGYIYNSVDKEKLVIGTGNNVINIYYEKINVTITKIAVDARGQEVEALYKYNEGEKVYYRLSVKNNGSSTIPSYTVTDTLPQELRYANGQEGVSGNTLTWNITNLSAGATTTKTITTIVNDKSTWQTEVEDATPEATIPTKKTGKAMNYWEYVRNTNKYNTNSEYYNCSFHLYNSQNGEVPHEDGSTQYPAENYSHVGFGRVDGIEYNTELSSIQDLNTIINTNNLVAQKITYAPEYPEIEGKLILWYVAKEINWAEETINGTTAFVKYHVDGVIVDINEVYSITNTAIGSDGKTASDMILASEERGAVSLAMNLMSKATTEDIANIESRINEVENEVENEAENEVEKAEKEEIKNDNEKEETENKDNNKLDNKNEIEKETENLDDEKNDSNVVTKPNECVEDEEINNNEVDSSETTIEDNLNEKTDSSMKNEVATETPNTDNQKENTVNNSLSEETNNNQTVDKEIINKTEDSKNINTNIKNNDMQ